MLQLLLLTWFSSIRYICAHLMYQNCIYYNCTKILNWFKESYIYFISLFFPTLLKWFVVCTLWFCLFANFQSMTCANLTHQQWNHTAIRLLIYIYVFSTTHVTITRHNKCLDVIEKDNLLVSTIIIACTKKNE